MLPAGGDDGRHEVEQRRADQKYRQDTFNVHFSTPGFTMGRNPLG
jgi:hypothetical protein